MKTNAIHRKSNGLGIEPRGLFLPVNSSRRSLASAIGALAASLTLGASSLPAQEIEAQGFMLPAAPVVACAKPSQDCLWSPNHKFTTITIENVFVPGNACAGVLIYRVTSDEPNACIKGSGGPVHAPDAAIACDGQSVDLRAERSGGGNGRVYQIKFVAWNKTLADSGPLGLIFAIMSAKTGCVEVSVPHDQKGKECCPAVDDGQCFVLDRLLNGWTDDDED